MAVTFCFSCKQASCFASRQGSSLDYAKYAHPHVCVLDRAVLGPLGSVESPAQAPFGLPSTPVRVRSRAGAGDSTHGAC